MYTRYHSSTPSHQLPVIGMVCIIDLNAFSVYFLCAHGATRGRAQRDRDVWRGGCSKAGSRRPQCGWQRHHRPRDNARDGKNARRRKRNAMPTKVCTIVDDVTSIMVKRLKPPHHFCDVVTHTGPGCLTWCKSCLRRFFLRWKHLSAGVMTATVLLHHHKASTLGGLSIEFMKNAGAAAHAVLFTNDGHKKRIARRTIHGSATTIHLPQTQTHDYQPS